MAFRKKICCKCGSDSNVIGCMFEGCDHYWCRDHCLKVDGEGVLEGIKGFWCGCHKTTLPQDCAYVLRCGDPDEGECGVCADPRAFICEYGSDAGHRPSSRTVCFKHCAVFRDEDQNVIKIWCNNHPGERPGKREEPTRRCNTCYTKKNVFKCAWPGCRWYGCYNCHARRPGPPREEDLPSGVEPRSNYLDIDDFPTNPTGEVICGPVMIQCVRHYVPMDTEYSRIRNAVSEVTMVSTGTSTFTHVDVGEQDAEPARGRAYPPQVETINPTDRQEDMTIMREMEPPMDGQPNPLLVWARKDRGTTSSEERSDSDTYAPHPRDVLETSGESIVEPPAPKRVRRIELVHVPKQGDGPPTHEFGRVPERGYGPPTPPPAESDGEVPVHERTQDDHVRLMHERVIRNSIEIERRDEIIRKNEAVDRGIAERRRVASAQLCAESIRR
eukprot:783569-Amphidinium_carterae.1